MAPAENESRTPAQSQNRFLDLLRARPFKLPSSSTKFRVLFQRKIDWRALFLYLKTWIKNPFHVALLIWAVACATVFLLMIFISIGVFNGVIKENSKRKDWVEACNQILNALFTIMCVYQYPMLIHHALLLLRWTADDGAALRDSYSKKSLPRPWERLHIAFVVFLLHLTCFFQFALCSLFWAFNRSSRPDDAVTAFLAAGIAAPLVAAVYTLWGPLGRRVEGESVVGWPAAEHRRQEAVTRAQWAGGLFDCQDDMTVTYLSFFCTFCVFGWNMERLGFGNMYVHIFTFVFLVATPVWVFAVTGLQIDDHGVRQGVAIVGVLLCFFGFLYGGFWRIQMRKKFKLPGNYFFWGNPILADCAHWLFCWSCALAQEVRTGNFYDIEDGRFFSKNLSSSDEEIEGESEKPVLKPLPRETVEAPVRAMEPPLPPSLGQPVSRNGSP